ncbi:MAG: hypothetical protein IJO86_02035 [Oscillospiraceae bacterium]|nr:hypothetical protein [Oscillospiraceae bacterium]
MTKTKKICDFDCFNCKYSDCINDRLEYDDYLAVEKIDKLIIDKRENAGRRKMSKLAMERKKAYHTENPLDKKAYARAYYDLNRERYKKYRLENKERKSAYDRNYFEKNSEKINERNKIYGLKNKQHLREAQKRWREKNREKLRAYQREYYKKRKEQKETN